MYELLHYEKRSSVELNLTTQENGSVNLHWLSIGEIDVSIVAETSLLISYYMTSSSALTTVEWS